MAISAITKILTLTFLAFVFALSVTPLLFSFLKKYKLGKNIRNDGTTPFFSELHKHKAGTPTMGGILIWGTLFFFFVLFWFFDRVLHVPFFTHFDFYSRKETLLPFGALIGASLVGAVDDWLDVRQRGHKGRGLRFRFKIILYAVVATIGAWWFYFKLGFNTVYFPFYGNVDLGWLFVPFFILVVISTSFSVNETDGLDGLAAGCLMASFLSFAFIAFTQGKYDLVVFLGVVCGSLLAFLWFNIYPAKFYMGDTGSMGMGVLLAVVAFLTNSVFLLFLLGFVFVAEALSFLLQISWRKIFKKKLFLAAPLHHHFEVLGWPEAKVTMRLWIIAGVTSVIGLLVYFLG